MQDLRVTLAQQELFWEDIPGNLSRFEEALEDLSPGSTDLIVLPEMFSTGFTMNARQVAEPMDGTAVKWMRNLAAKKNAAVTGSLVIEENGRYYNRLVWMRPDKTCSVYDKRHLFRMAEEHQTYTAGEKKLVEELNGWKICPLVCYDLRFPVWSRNTEPYDVLIYVANWPERRSFAWKHLLVARAIENQVYTIGLNRVGKDGKDISYSGDSVVLNPRGEAMSSIPPGEAHILSIRLSYSELDEYRRQFPAFMDADRFTIH
jgi:omega-amidase